MGDIIDFLAIKEAKEVAQREQQLQQHVAQDCHFEAPENIDKLVANKALQVDDHKLFLAFLSEMQQQEIEPMLLFMDVFILSPQRFEHEYNLKWWQSVQLTCTFLAILKANEPKNYERFLQGHYDE